MLIPLLRRHLRPYRGPIAVVVLFQLAQTIANLYLPGLNAEIIDDGVVRGDVGRIWTTGGVMLLVTVLQVACTVVAVYVGARVAMALGRDLRAGVFDAVEGFAARELAHFGAPTLVTRATNDVQQVQLLVFMALTLLVSAPIMAVGGVAMALRQDVELSGLLVVVIPVLVVAVGLIIRTMRPLFRQMQERIDGLNDVMREQIQGIRVVRAFATEEREAERFARANQAYVDVAVAAGRVMALMFPTVMLVMNVSVVAATWFGGYRIASGDLQVGTLTAFQNYLVQILMAVMMATFMLMLWPRAEVSAERITEVLETEPSIVAAPDADDTPVARGALEVRDASFAYPGAEQDVLHGVSLVARPGETTAVVGSTGSGKSTLVNLVPRLFDVTAGQVLLDGRDVRTMTPEAVWAAIGLVPQRAFLFSGTVASNLRYGRPDASDAELWEALRIAQLDATVAAMHDQLDTVIGRQGVRLSGGQRQRLAIARMILSEPSVVILDEATSALDAETEFQLHRYLEAFLKQRTTLIIAHRLSAVKQADRACVFEDGRIIEEGHHDELIAREGLYAQLYGERQM